MATPGEHLADQVASLRLVDHHVHGPFAAEPARAEFEVALNEGAPDPVPAWMTQFDSQLGFAIRRWCAPLLDLPPHAPADRYWARRSELGVGEVNRRFLQAAGVAEWLVDTGFDTDAVLGPAGLAAASGGRAREILRLESLAEQVAAEGVPGPDYADEFGARLAATDAVGLKTILAYRAGFEIDLSRPGAREVAEAAQRFADGGVGRLVDPVLLRHGLHAGIARGLPLQVHTGLGDRDLDLHRCNPLLLLDFLRRPEVAQVPIVLLHCYPYHREAGYLAQAFPNVHLDVGLAVNHLGVRARAVVAEAFELAPFAKLLHSSDAWGPPELHYLGAHLWRRALTTVLGRWVADDDWSLSDAKRVVDMVGAANARRVYRLA